MDPDELMRLLARQQDQIAELTKAVVTLSARQSATATVSNETFTDLWSRYVRTLPNEPWVRHQVSLMQASLRQFGERKASEIRPRDWTDYRDEKRKPKVQVSTRNAELKRVRAMYAWAVREERLSENPFLKVKLEPKKPPRETEISDDGLVRLLEHANPVLAVFIVVALGTGMRHEEVRTLKWEQIDFKRRRLMLSWTGTKTKKSRTPRLSAEAVAALSDFPRTIGSPFVFANPETREPWCKSTFYAHWWAARDASGIEAAPGDGEVHIHDARHTYASNAARAGVSVPVIQRLLGHASLASVSRYLHADETDLDDARELLDAPRRGPKRAIPSVEADRDAGEVAR